MRIALTGKMRSGKDTFAKYFVNNEHCFPIAFGDGIKQVAVDYFPHIVSKGKPRELYQNIGQQFREIDKDVWIKKLDGTMNTLIDEGYQNFIITDVRQINEYTFLKDRGFTVIKIESADEIRIERTIQAGDIFEPKDFYHETEMTVDHIPCDYLVTNNDTLEALIDQIKYVHEELKGEVNGE